MPDRARHVDHLLPLKPKTLHILLALADGPRHGYSIMQEVAARTDGHVRVWPAAMYGTLGLVNGLTRAMAIHRRLLITSENTYFAQVQEAMGRDSAWTHLFRLAAGFDPGAPTAMPFQSRALAGLVLYRETVALMRDLLPERHLPVVDIALAAIALTWHALPG